MSKYQRLDFENRLTPVFVASGCGFKSPRAWGKRTIRRASDVESKLAETGLVRWSSAIDKTGKIKFADIDKNRKLNEMIEEEMKQLLNLDLQEEVDYLQTASENLEIQLMTASADAGVILKSQQDIIKIDLTESRRQLRAETALREDRIDKLRGLRFPGAKGPHVG